MTLVGSRDSTQPTRISRAIIGPSNKLIRAVNVCQALYCPSMNVQGFDYVRLQVGSTTVRLQVGSTTVYR